MYSLLELYVRVYQASRCVQSVQVDHVTPVDLELLVYHVDQVYQALVDEIDSLRSRHLADHAHLSHPSNSANIGQCMT